MKFKECFHVACLEPDKVILFSEKESFILRGRTYVLLAPHLQTGGFSEEELAEMLAPSIPREETYYALERLKIKKFIEVKKEVSQEFAAFCQMLGVETSHALEALSKKSVSIKNFSQVDEKPLIYLLEQMQIQIKKECDLTLVLVDDYLDSALETWHSKKPWLLMKPKGIEFWLGPFFEKKGCCYSCLSRRLQQNRLEEKSLSTFFPLSVAKVAASVEAAFSMAVTLIFKWLIGAFVESDKLISWDLSTFTMMKHKTFGYDNCVTCGEEIFETHPISFQSQEKKEWKEGGYHTQSPEETIKKFSDFISPICGVISPLKETLNTPSMHVYSAGNNFAVSNNRHMIGRNSLRQSCGGKGKTALQAQASALCEGLERYSLLFQGSEKTLFSSLKKMEHETIDIKRLDHFSQKQYLNRENWNKEAIQFHRISEPFQEECEIDWSPVWSLTKKKQIYIPSSYCYLGVPHERGGRFFRGNSNGCAAGNTLEEAVLQGFFELVERDATAIWWYNRVKRPQVDLKSFEDPFFDRLVAEYEKRGRDIWVLDVTSDLGIPSFTAVSCEKKGKKGILFGLGAHLNSKIGIERALTEMNQLLANPEFWKENSEDLDVKIHARWFAESLDTQFYFKGDGIKSAKDYSFVEKSDLLDDLMHCQSIVENRGMEMLVLDCTRKKIGLPVVRVIVPELRHFWPRFAPGRLYDVPVKLGWLQKQNAEEELNPIPLFL